MAEYMMNVGIPKEVPDEVIITIPNKIPGHARRLIYGKVQSALKRNTRVMYQDTNETKIALDLIAQMEKATGLLLSRVGMNPDDVVPFVRKYFKTLEELGEMIKAACEKAGIDYKEPRGLRLARGEDVSNVSNNGKKTKNGQKKNANNDNSDSETTSEAVGDVIEQESDDLPLKKAQTA